MMNPSFYNPLHSMYMAGTASGFATAPAVTPTSSTTSAPSPPTSRGYEGASSSSPDLYGYPPTPPKEVKTEESYPGSAISALDMYSSKPRPEGSESTYTSTTSTTPISMTTPTFQSSDLGSPLYGSYSTTGIFEKSQKSTKSKCNQNGKLFNKNKTCLFLWWWISISISFTSLIKYCTFYTRKIFVCILHSNNTIFVSKSSFLYC